MKSPWHEHKLWRNPITSFESAGGFALLRNVLNPARSAADSDATLELNPHPGGIGGRVAGTIKLPRNTGAVADCVVRLSCISNFTTDSGDYPDDRFEILWEQELHVTPKSNHNGVKVEFAFDQLPANLPESELPFAGGYVDWQLTLAASADNARLRHTFSIPVFATDLYHQSRARTASKTETILSEWRFRNAWQLYRTKVETEGNVLVVRHGPWRGGMYQTGGLKGLVAVFLLLFLSVLLLMYANDELVSAVVTGVFGIVGLFVTGLAGYLLVRTVEIRAQPGQLSRDCRVFGRTVEYKSIRAEEILSFVIRDYVLYVDSKEFGELEIVDSVFDLQMLSTLRRLLVAALNPVR